MMSLYLILMREDATPHEAARVLTYPKGGFQTTNLDDTSTAV